MARSAGHFRQSDITRAIKAAVAGGLAVSRTEIAPDGRIVLIHAPELPSEPQNDYDQWKAKRDAR